MGRKQGGGKECTKSAKQRSQLHPTSHREVFHMHSIVGTGVGYASGVSYSGVKAIAMHVEGEVVESHVGRSHR